VEIYHGYRLAWIITDYHKLSLNMEYVAGIYIYYFFLYFINLSIFAKIFITFNIYNLYLNTYERRQLFFS